MNGILEVLPSNTCVSITRTWKRFLKRTSKLLHFTPLTSFAGVNARPSHLFCTIQFLCAQFYSAAHKEVVRITISTLIAACDLDAGKAGASCENQVKLVPVLRSRVSPGDSVLGLGIEERVTNTETVMTA